MSYYDLNAILTDSQKVPCTFQLTVPGLGYLGGNVGSDVKEGTKMALPLWLAEMLLMSSMTGNAPITMDMPSPLSTRVVNALKADPKTVDLRAQAPHFYALGARMLELFEDEDVLEVLIDTFKKRAVEISDRAGNSRTAGDGGDFMVGLEEEERKLFSKSHEGTAAVQKWFQSLNRS